MNARVLHMRRSAGERPEELPVVARYKAAATSHHLKIRQLVLLVHLGDERCLARAAAAAGLTQPAASKLLRQVESTLEVKLFDRHARGMVPTCYGEILLRYARLALSELGRAREEIAALKSGGARKITLGVCVDSETQLISMTVARLKQRHPGVVFAIEIDSSPELIRKLLHGNLDMVALRRLDSARPEGCCCEPLGAEVPHAIVAGARHPLAGRKTLSLQSLAEQTWILPPVGSVLRENLCALFANHRLPVPTNSVETDSVPLITTLLKQSNMVAAMPEDAIESCCGSQELTRLVGNLTLGVGAFGVIAYRDQKLSPSAQIIVKTMRELTAELSNVDTSRTMKPALAAGSHR